MTDPKGDCFKSPAEQPGPDQYIHVAERGDNGKVIQRQKSI